MNTNSFYSITERAKIGLNSIRYVRIDEFCILSGNIKIESHIHISAYVAMYGKFVIEMEDYSEVFPRCTIFSANNDFSGENLISQTVEIQDTKVARGKVLIYKYGSSLKLRCILYRSIH